MDNLKTILLNKYLGIDRKAGTMHYAWIDSSAPGKLIYATTAAFDRSIPTYLVTFPFSAVYKINLETLVRAGQ